MSYTTMQQVYLLAQEHCGLKVGDYVRLIRGFARNEGGCTCTEATEYNEKGRAIGKVGKIKIISNDGIVVGFKGIKDTSYSSWMCPYFVLEKVEKPAHEFKPFDRVLVRDDDYHRWYPDIFLYRPNICPELYACAKSAWKQCIPYDGNEHLVGTCKEPDNI